MYYKRLKLLPFFTLAAKGTKRNYIQMMFFRKCLFDKRWVAILNRWKFWVCNMQKVVALRAQFTYAHAPQALNLELVGQARLRNA